MTTAETATPLLAMRGLSVAFRGETGETQAVLDLDIDIAAGRTLAIVGESGSGKSVTSLAIMGLTRFSGGTITAGSITYTDRQGKPVDLVTADEPAMRRIRGNEIAMIFQEPMTSLNPVFTIGDQIAETIELHQGVSRSQAMSRARELLARVRLPDPDRMLGRFPHELSGGMRQRVMIAMALSCRPRLLIADEPTTALDVSVQAQILTLIRELQQELGMAVIFITHDMGLVAEMADDVVVMWRGRKVESGTVGQIFANPEHPYTRMLLAAVPRLGSLADEPLPVRMPVTTMAADGAISITGERKVLDTASLDRPLLRLDKLTVRFDTARALFGRVTHRVHAVEGVSFDIHPGETLGLVGESGSGKSTIGRAIQQLVRPTSGSITFDGWNQATISQTQRRDMLRDIQYVFQDPFASLDPRQTVGASIAEPILVHSLMDNRAEITARVGDLLEQVGLPRDRARLYPHEFSGGQRQRICIARALASKPRLVIADEAVSALDVSVQAQILALMMDLQAQMGLAYLFISHDMAVIEKMCHRVAVMYLGQIVEIGPRQAVLNDPQHPYTAKLLASVPVPDPGRRPDRSRITGDIPSAMRKVGDEPVIHSYREVSKGHFVAQ